MPLLLGVNIDHVATLRQARYAGDPFAFNAEPSPVDACLDAIAGGADSITIHVRGDRRHMQDADAIRIAAEVDIPLNLEMGITDEMTNFALQLRPAYACLVPEVRQEITTEGGLDVVSGFEKTMRCVERLQEVNTKVSLFIDPDTDQVEAAATSGAKMIELHTGCFANARGEAVPYELQRLIDAARLAHSLGLQVNAGHGINYVNIPTLLNVPFLTELNIGHSIIARSIRVGLTQAVLEMKQQMSAYPEWS